MAHDLPPAGRGRHRYLPEGLPLTDIRQVYLHRRNIYRPQSIVNGIAVMGIGCRVDDDTVIDPRRLLNGVDDSSLVIALEAVRLPAVGGGIVLYPAAQGLLGSGAVDIRLPAAQQIQIRPVDDEKLHTRFLHMAAMTSAAACAVSSRMA